MGQIDTQGASVQWLQRMTENDRLVSGQVPVSMYLTQVRSTPRGTSCSVLHATVQAWQPMHAVWSMTKPYCNASPPDPERRCHIGNTRAGREHYPRTCRRDRNPPIDWMISTGRDGDSRLGTVP